jgi:hypothetical protein
MGSYAVSITYLILGSQEQMQESQRIMDTSNMHESMMFAIKSSLLEKVHSL